MFRILLVIGFLLVSTRDMFAQVTITVSPTTVTAGAGASVTASWSGIPSPTAKDWLLVSVHNAPPQTSYPNNDPRWLYVDCTKQGKQPQASGSCSFDLSTLGVNTYNVRLYANDGISEIGRSSNFTIVTSAPTQDPEIPKLWAAVTILQGQVAVLQGQVSNLLARMSTVESLTAALNATVADLTSRVTALEKQNPPDPPDPLPPGPLPGFLIETASGSTHVYSSEAVNDAVLVSATTYEGGGRWKLAITQAKQAIKTVYFPWQPNRAPLDSDLSNDIYYYPYLLGRTEKAPNHNVDWTWWGLPYPGGASAPLIVMADPSSAKIVAATNWPPKPVTPMYAATRLVLRYENVAIPVNGAATYGAIVHTVTGNTAIGDVPWQKALDLYKSWLDASMGAVTYPAWMWAGQGAIDVQLEAYSSLSQFDPFWQANKARYPWLLMWGQNSPLGESCCGISPTTLKYYLTLFQFNSRWVPSLVDWAKKEASAGFHVGYYSAPYDGQYGDGTDRLLDTPAGMSWFSGWNSANQQGGANSYYFDVLARRPWGHPDALLKLFSSGAIPTDAMSEGHVDVYPLPGLLSGSLAGGATCGAPHRTPESATITTFPFFMRYLLNDRLGFWGWENDDFQFQGVRPHSGCDYAAYCANGQCDYGVERVLFLTGSRIMFANGFANVVHDAIVAERERVNWWPRRPRFLATKGLNLTTISAASRVEITHFQDMNGVSLVAISNPNLVAGLSFTRNGVTVAVPVQRIAIVE